jgi:hypothetical protein
MRGRGHGRVVFLLRGAIVLAVLMLRPLAASAAPVLLGDSVQAGLFGASTVVTPFTSPAIVGSGLEFTGLVRGPRSDGIWDVWVDVRASSFSIGWVARGADVAFTAHSAFTVIGLSLSGLDFTPAAIITGVTRTDYSCTPAGTWACSMGGAIDPVLNFTDNAIDLGFSAMRSGEIYTFDIATTESTATPVPEPGSLALLGTGFATFIAGRYRRRGARPPTP